MTDLKRQIDELASIKADMSKLKERKDKLEAEIIMQCSEDLENTKYKSVHYAGTESELTAVTSESLKVTYNSFLLSIFGKAYKDVNNILKFTNLSEDDAKEYAYLISEAAVWQDFKNLLTVNGMDESHIDDILMKIQSSFVVEDSTKISLSSLV